MKKIMILCGYYWPGFKGGGPIQACMNIVENLSDYFEFYVVTSDRDLGDTAPYENVKINAWNDIGKAHIYYVQQEKRTLKGLEPVINSVPVDAIFMNGFFAPKFTQKPLLLRKKHKLQDTRFILSPRGDFTGGCRNKKLKKYTYIYLTKLTGLYKGLIWHASSELEAQAIHKKYPKAKVVTITDLPEKYEPKPLQMTKEKGKLKMIFVSRIFPKKNLKFALEVLKEITEGEVEFDIYGPMEDSAYWEECKTVISQLPGNVHAEYKGKLTHDRVGEAYSAHHVFFFPTLGENYGYVIVEAMMNNCLCLLSKGTTPWDDYVKLTDLGADLKDRDKMVSDIRRLIEMDHDSFCREVEKTTDFIAKRANPSAHVEKYRQLFEGEI